MRRFRWSRLSICIFLFVVTLIFSASAHSGRTDSKGGHYDRSTGEYHYHHGYPAHDHIDGICPYDFDDKTDHDSGETLSPENDPPENPEDKFSWTELILPYIVLAIMFGILFIIDIAKPRKKDSSHWFSYPSVALWVYTIIIYATTHAANFPGFGQFLSNYIVKAIFFCAFVFFSGRISAWFILGITGDDFPHIAADGLQAYWAVQFFHVSILSPFIFSPASESGWHITAMIILRIISIVIFAIRKIIEHRKEQYRQKSLPVEPVHIENKTRRPEDDEEKQAWEQHKNDIVIVVKRGQLYHHPECWYIAHKHERTEMTIEEAVNKRKSPCHRCCSITEQQYLHPPYLE